MTDTDRIAPLPFEDSRGYGFLNFYKLPTESLYDIFSFAHQPGQERLLYDLSRFMIENFEEVSKCNSFLELSLASFTAILSQKWYFKSDKDEILVDGIIRWINHSCGERRSSFRKLIGLIDSKNVSFKYKAFISKNLRSESSSLLFDLTDLVTPRSKDSSRSHQSSPKSKLNIFNSSISGVTILSLDKNTQKWNQRAMGVMDSNVTCVRCVGLDVASLESHYLYLLDYNLFRGHKFRATASIDIPSELTTNSVQLSTPPFTSSPLFDMCGAHGRIYASTIESPSAVYAYEAETDKWCQLPNFELAMGNASISVLNNTLYAFGSIRNKGSGRTAMLQALDQRTSKWRSIPNSRTYHVHEQCCGHDGKIYVSFTKPGWGSQIEVYDPVAGRWESMEPVPHENFQIFRFASYENCLWMCGPLDGKTFHVKKYNTSIGVWESADLSQGLASYSYWRTDESFFVF